MQVATESWKAKAERGSAWLIHLIAWLARTVGRPCCRALLYPIVLYFVLTDATARRASREFLALAYARRAGIADVFRHVYWFAATLLDRVYMASGDFDRFDVAVLGDDLVRDALASGKGCVLLGSHLGSFDLMSLKNKVLHDRPVTLLMHVDDRSRVRRIAGIDDSKLSIIPLGRFDSYLRAYDVLARGGIIVALADRAEKSASLRSTFFGRPAAFPIGPHAGNAAGATVLDGLRVVALCVLSHRDRRMRAGRAERQPRGRAATGRRQVRGAARELRAALSEELVQLLSVLGATVSSTSATGRSSSMPPSTRARQAPPWDGVWIAIPAYDEERTILPSRGQRARPLLRVARV